MSDDREPTELTIEQRRRVEALKAARLVLVSRQFASAGAVEPDAVMRVADYILDGRDWPLLEGEKLL